MLRRATLDNGLKVLLQEEHTAPLASVWCWYKVGSKDETTGLTGVSHWVEHMNFKGTTNIPREQIKGIIEKFGGSWNGYTWIDQTTYMETASTAGLDRMLFIESERMANCVYVRGIASPRGPSSSRSCREARTIPTRCWSRKSSPLPTRCIRIGTPRSAGSPTSRR